MADEDGKTGEGSRISEAVIAFFNRGKRLAWSLLRENEQLRTRIQRLEQDLSSAAAEGRGEGGPSGCQRDARPGGHPAREDTSGRAAPRVPEKA